LENERATEKWGSRIENGEDQKLKKMRIKNWVKKKTNNRRNENQELGKEEG
jgi:hypothetical protein